MVIKLYSNSGEQEILTKKMFCYIIGKVFVHLE